MKKNGFTLIELLISFALFGVVSLIVISILLTTFRLSKKSEILTVVKQNGTNALTQMEKQIRFAQDLNDPSDCSETTTQTSIQITSITDQLPTTFSCMNDTIASNSVALIDPNFTVTNCSFICSQTGTNTSPQITIMFSLLPKETQGLSDDEVTIPFSTSLILRNVIR